MPSRAILQRAAVAALVLTAARPSCGFAQSAVLVDIKDLTPQEHRSAAFVLSSPQDIRIDAVGAEPRRREDRDDWDWNIDERDTWPAAAWILDARTRLVVWDLRTAETVRSGPGLRQFSGTVRLPAGVYEAHYGSFVATSVSYNGDVKDLIAWRREARRRHARYDGPYVRDRSYRKFALQILGAGRPATASDLDAAVRAFTSSVVLTVRPAGHSESARRAFELTRPLDAEVYAIGELRRDDAFDYGWIQNADTRQRVWQMAYRHTEDAGGAHKNRMVKETIHLPAGRYVAYFVNDDSHDPEEWNAVPPLDPESWGLTLRVADASARGGVRVFEWEPVPAGQTIVSLTGIGDDELRSEGFTLRRPMEVHVYALGEGSDPDGEMEDYAWIVDLSTRRRVWSMRYDATEHAGGAEKNRLFDGVMRLEAGSYLVYYKSDGSHSFDHWNDTPPAEARYWGVSLFPAGGRLDPTAVGPIERGASTALAELVRVKNDKHKRTLFTLEQPTTVRVYAIGEASGGEMADYGWIEDAGTGDRVWEMTYGETSHAGGARKNRLFDGTIRLAAGRYVLHYDTDGSHAFGDWNDDPPDDPDGWGITLTVTPR